MTDFENYHGCLDLPDSRDITAEELDLLGTSELPEKVQFANTPILSQGNIGACTVFGLSGATFESAYNDEIENGGVYSQPFDPWDRWKKAKTLGASDSQGWSLQGALSLLTDIRDIVGYAKLANPGKITLDLIARTIASGRMIYTGSARGNWGRIGATHIYEEFDGFAGHAYCIVGYDLSRKVAIARNSWTDQWGDHGHFYIPEAMFAKLYSTYMILDPSDVEKMRDVRNAKAQSYNQKSIAKKIWTGERPNDIATFSEIRLMLSRAVDVLGARPRQYWATTFEEKILRGKGIITIWNEKEGKRNATDMELATMFTRAVKRDPKISTLSLTRFQVSCVIGRDLLP